MLRWGVWLIVAPIISLICLIGFNFMYRLWWHTDKTGIFSMRKDLYGDFIKLVSTETLIPGMNKKAILIDLIFLLLIVILSTYYPLFFLMYVIEDEVWPIWLDLVLKPIFSFIITMSPSILLAYLKIKNAPKVDFPFEWWLSFLAKGGQAIELMPDEISFQLPEKWTYNIKFSARNFLKRSMKYGKTKEEIYKYTYLYFVRNVLWSWSFFLSRNPKMRALNKSEITKRVKLMINTFNEEMKNNLVLDERFIELKRDI